MEAVSTGPRRLRPLQGSAQLTCKGLRKVLCTEACPFHSNDGKCNDGGDTDVKEAAVRLERRVAHTQPLRGNNNSNTKSPRPTPKPPSIGWVSGEKTRTGQVGPNILSWASYWPWRLSQY